MQSAIPSVRRSGARLPAFTLPELMVAIGCTLLLAGVILPVTTKVRQQAQRAKCQENIRCLGLGLIAYSQDTDGYFPINMTSPAPGLSWCDAQRIGKYLKSPTTPSDSVYACPTDADSIRSYAMNFWASGGIDYYYPASYKASLWKATTSRADQLILLAESWSSQGTQATGYYSPPCTGQSGSSEGQRFGSRGGIPLIREGRFGLVNCELAYQRHRDGGPGEGVEPIGRVSIAFADGHVECLSDGMLLNASTGAGSGKAVWYPGDPP